MTLQPRLRPAPPTTATAVTGIILAGGRAMRMGGQDKGLLRLAERPLISYSLERLKPQVATILISANRNADIYSSLGMQVIADERPGFPGPLGGIAAALLVAPTPWVVIVPCDAPFLAVDFVERLAEAASNSVAHIISAAGMGRLQPTFALLHRGLLGSLQDFLNNGGRKVELWYRQHSLHVVEFDHFPNMFVNINTPQDLRAAEALMLHERP